MSRALLLWRLHSILVSRFWHWGYLVLSPALSMSRPQLMFGLLIFAFLFALGSNGFAPDISYNLPFSDYPVSRCMMFITILGFLQASEGFDAPFGQEDKSLSKILYIASGSILGIALLGAFGAFTNIVETPKNPCPLLINTVYWQVYLICLLCLLSPDGE